EVDWVAVTLWGESPLSDEEVSRALTSTFSWPMSSGVRSGSQHLKNSRPSFGSQVSDSFLRRHGLKYLGLILQRYGLVEGTPDNETPSLFLYMFVVPDPSFILKAMARVMYLYNLRVWSVQSASRPNL